MLFCVVTAYSPGQSDTARLLVTRGADPRHPTLDGNNYLPMDIAMDQCDSEMMALLTEGIAEAQRRRLPVISISSYGSEQRLKSHATASASLGYDDETFAYDLDNQSVNSDFDTRSVNSTNSQLFFPAQKRSLTTDGPLRSLRRFRERVRRPSPSPALTVKDNDGNTSEDNSYCTVNEFITDLFAGALRGAVSGSLSSVTADDSQDSLASFPNSSDSPQSLYLSEGLHNSLQAGRNSSPEGSKTSSSSMLSDDSMHLLNSYLGCAGSKKSLVSASHYNSNGSLVSREQPVMITSPTSPQSSGIHVCSSGSVVTSTPVRIPGQLETRSYGCSTEDVRCCSPSYDVPRSGVRRKVQTRRTLNSLHDVQLGTSFDYDVPHSALKRLADPTGLQGLAALDVLSMSDECANYACQQEDSGTFVSATDVSRGHMSRESTIVADENSQITPQASFSRESPTTDAPVASSVNVSIICASNESLQGADGSRRTQVDSQDNSIIESSQSRLNPSANSLEASDSTLGVRSSTSIQRFSPEFELTQSAKIKDSFTSIQSLPNFRHCTPDHSATSSCYEQEPRSPFTPESTDSEDLDMLRGDYSQVGYSTATLPGRGRHGSKRPHVHAVLSPCNESPVETSRLSVGEFLLSLSPSGPPESVKEQDVEEEVAEGEDVISLLGFLSSNGPLDASQSPAEASNEAQMSIEDLLLSADALDLDDGGKVRAAIVSRTRAEDHKKPDRPMSLVSDWMVPVESSNLMSHVATLPRGASPSGSDSFKRNAASRGSLRRLINKATRASKKQSGSDEVVADKRTQSTGSDETPASGRVFRKKRNQSIGSDDVQLENGSLVPDEQASQPKKSFLQRTAALRSSFRSKKGKKLRGSRESEEGPLGSTEKSLATKSQVPGQRQLPKSLSRDSNISEGSYRHSRTSANVALAMTAL